MSDDRLQIIEKQIDLFKKVTKKIRNERNIDRKIEIISDCRDFLNIIDASLEEIYYDLLEEEDEQEN